MSGGWVVILCVVSFYAGRIDAFVERYFEKRNRSEGDK